MKKSKKTLEYEQSIRTKSSFLFYIFKNEIDKIPGFLDKESLNYKRLTNIHILFKKHYYKVYLHISKNKTETNKNYMRRKIRTILDQTFLDLVFASDDKFIAIINRVIENNEQFSEVADHTKS
jgi:hypothetical protein